MGKKGEARGDWELQRLTEKMTKPIVSSWAPSGRACLQFFCIRATRQVQTTSLLSESSSGSSSSRREILNWGLLQNVSVEDAGQADYANPGPSVLDAGPLGDSSHTSASFPEDRDTDRLCPPPP